jgi:hypothetical protein
MDGDQTPLWRARLIAIEFSEMSSDRAAGAGV